MIETTHAIQRRSQRSIPEDILQIVFLFGEYVGEDKVYFSQKSAVKAKSELSGFEHLNSDRRLNLGSSSDVALFFGQTNTDRSNINQIEKGSITKKWMNALNKYIGVSVIIDRDVVITCYRCKKNQKKRMSWLRKEKFVH